MSILDKRGGLCAWPTFDNETGRNVWSPPTFACLHIAIPADGLLCAHHLRLVSGGPRGDGQRARRERDGGHHLWKTIK